MSIIGVHNVIIIGTTNGCVFSASCSNYAFHASIFSAQQTFTTSYFRRKILGLVGKISSWLKINKRGGCNKNVLVCIFRKINSRGDVYSGLESTYIYSLPPSNTIICFSPSSTLLIKKLRKFSAGFLRPKQVHKLTNI